MSWNTQGKPWSTVLQTLDDAEVDAHLIALQEASAPQGTSSCEGEPICTDTLHGYVVVAGAPPGCHRKLAFCFDEFGKRVLVKFKLDMLISQPSAPSPVSM